MADNKLISDLRVKSAKVLEFGTAGVAGGSVYQSPAQAYFIPGKRYKLQIVFGNASSPVRYEDERFRKDLVEVRIVGMGFRVAADQYVDQDSLTFFTNGQFTTPVSGDRFRFVWRPGVAGATMPGVFPTDAADTTFDAYFQMQSPRMSQRGITTWVWQMGIYGSVRNMVWRQTRASV